VTGIQGQVLPKPFAPTTNSAPGAVGNGHLDALVIGGGTGTGPSIPSPQLLCRRRLIPYGGSVVKRSVG